jgi:hypothetical protein
MTNHYDPETTALIRPDNKIYYVGADELSKDIGDILNENTLEHKFKCSIMILRYNCKLLEPFLQFLLLLDGETYRSLNIEITNKIFDVARVNHSVENDDFDYDEYFESLIMKKLEEKLNINDAMYNKNMEYMGFYKQDNELFVFLLSDYEMELNLEIDTNWTTIDEIVCHKKVDKNYIQDTLLTLFKKNKKFMYIKNDEDEYIDIPIVCYNIELKEAYDNGYSIEYKYIQEKKVEAVSSYHKVYGDRYVFVSNGKKDSVKFVLFLGQCFYVFNETDVVLLPPENYNKNYDDKDTLFVSDLDNNSYYLVNNITNFMKL